MRHLLPGEISSIHVLLGWEVDFRTTKYNCIAYYTFDHVYFTGNCMCVCMYACILYIYFTCNPIPEYGLSFSMYLFVIVKP